MSETKNILAAASLMFLFASGFAGAAPHSQSQGPDVSGHQGLVDAAKRVHIDGHASRKAQSGVI